MSNIKGKTPLLTTGLPVVSAKTIAAIQHVYSGKTWGRQLEEARARLLQENPQLVRFIERQVGKFPLEFHNAIFEVVVGTLTVLEHQAMIDQQASRRTEIRKG